MILGPVRMKKALREYDFYEGEKVWLRSKKFASKVGAGKPVGVVVKDSHWPDLWVTVDLWDKEKGMDFLNGKESVKCPKRLR